MDEIYTFGDSINDKEMFSVTKGKKIARFFNLI